ncbi:MAG: hypothetical protein ACOCXJ_01070 [Planctomycetota bacterium]
MASLRGRYFFADSASGRVWHADAAARPLDDVQDITAAFAGFERPVSFAVDAAGHLYLSDLDGDLFRLEPEQPRRVIIAIGPSSPSGLEAHDAHEQLPVEDGGAVFDWRHAEEDLRIGIRSHAALAASDGHTWSR